MPTPTESTKISLGQRLRERARERWPALATVNVRHRGGFAYVTGELADGTALPLCRLRYGGYATGGADRTVGHVSQEELKRSPVLAGEPRGGEHQGTCEHQEAGVAEGEFEANAQPRRSIHRGLPYLRRLLLCRCGSRRRAPWRSARVRRVACAGLRP